MQSKVIQQKLLIELKKSILANHEDVLLSLTFGQIIFQESNQLQKEYNNNLLT